MSNILLYEAGMYRTIFIVFLSGILFGALIGGHITYLIMKRKFKK